jgi:hypothetical protein
VSDHHPHFQVRYLSAEFPSADRTGSDAEAY